MMDGASERASELDISSVDDVGETNDIQIYSKMAVMEEL